MSITTKIGDKGTTRLLSGENVPKDDMRLEVYGTLDELNAHLGMARSVLTSAAPLAQEIRELQLEVFRLSAELAAINPEQHQWVELTTDAHVAALEARMQRIEQQLHLPRSFLVPGTCPASAALEVARTVARRCERCAVRLFKSGDYGNRAGLVFINRLSDYCFLLARAAELALGVPFDPKTPQVS